LLDFLVDNQFVILNNCPSFKKYSSVEVNTVIDCCESLYSSAYDSGFVDENKMKLTLGHLYNSPISDINNKPINNQRALHLNTDDVFSKRENLLKLRSEANQNSKQVTARKRKVKEILNNSEYYHPGEVEYGINCEGCWNETFNSSQNTNNWNGWDDLRGLRHWYCSKKGCIITLQKLIKSSIN
jgi:hypothetical protein